MPRRYIRATAHELAAIQLSYTAEYKVRPGWQAKLPARWRFRNSSGPSNASPLITASSPKRARTRSTACSAIAARPSTRSAGSAWSDVTSAARADADQPEARAVGLALEQVARGGEDAAGELGRRVQRAGAGADFEVRGFQFQRHRGPGELLGFQARRDLLGQAPQDFFERAKVGKVALEGGFRGYALGFAIGAHRAVVEAAGKPRQAAAFLAVAAEELSFADALQVGDAMESVAGEPRHAGLADAVNKTRGLWRQERGRFAAAEHGKAARLVEIGCDLGEEFVASKPDRHRDAQRLLDLRGKPRQRLGRPHAVQPFGAGEIEERLVDRQRLDQRRQGQHHRPHFAPGF